MRRFDLLAAAEAERRAARLAEIARQAERLEALSVAQEEAQAEIALRIDPVTPAFVREFLSRWWSRALAHARVDGDGSAAGWNDALRAGELLIWSVAPKMPEDIARLASLLPRLIQGLMKGLADVGIEQADRERFFNELLQWHTARSRMPAQRRAAQAGHCGRRADGSDGTIRFGTPTPAARCARRCHGRRRWQRCAFASGRGDPGSTRCSAATWSRSRSSTAAANAAARVDQPGRRLCVLTRFPDIGRSLSRREIVSLFESGRARRTDSERRSPIRRLRSQAA